MSAATEAYFASRAMQALEVLAFGPSTATVIANELHVHPRTARRLLNRMVYDGWLTRLDRPRPAYTPTLRIVALAAEMAQRAPLIRLGLERARELQAQTGGSVHLAIPSYRSTLRLLRVDSRGDATLTRDLAPAHATAAGKLLLALREPWRGAVLAGPLAAITQHTLADPRMLRADLERTRGRGYATEDQELHADVRALAAPVTSPEAEVIAALAISCAHEQRDLLANRDRLLAAAADLSSSLAQT